MATDNSQESKREGVRTHMFKHKPLVIGAAATVAMLALGTLGPANAHAASPARKHKPASGATNPRNPTKLPVAPGQVALDGALLSPFNSNATTFTIQTAKFGPVAATLATTATIVRRYGAKSALDEFAPGDNVEVTGVMSGSNAITAYAVKDYSIQMAYTRNVGVITAVSSDFKTVTVKVLKDSKFPGQNPFDEGATITLDVSPSMTVTLDNGSTGVLQDYLMPGIKITTLGVYSRTTKTFIKVARIRIDSPSVGDMTSLHGTLQPGFSPLTPVTLTVQTPWHGTVYVGVSTTTKLYRRFNGVSSLYEFAAGDFVGFTAKWLGGSNYAATAVRDDSIQRDDSYSLDKITAINLVTPTGSLTPTATISATVLVPGSDQKDNPFKAGQAIVLNTNGNTKVMLPNGTLGTLSSLAVGQTISANGLVNRKATPMAYTQVATIRIH